MHDALLVSLVSGFFIPPIRLDYLKRLHHPDLVTECKDPDCTLIGCAGNRLELLFRAGGEAGGGVGGGGSGEADAGAGDEDDEAAGEWFYNYSTTDITFHVVHGKNDRCDSRDCYQINFTAPRGDLVKLLLAHIQEGHGIMTMEHEEATTIFFNPRSKMAFSDSTFTQYWQVLLKRPGDGGTRLPYFPPSKCRQIFVDDYILMCGKEPLMLDGASAVMGNTVRQWRDSYNPSRRRVAARRAVAHHATFTAAVVAAARPAGGMPPGPESEFLLCD